MSFNELTETYRCHAAVRKQLPVVPITASEFICLPPHGIFKEQIEDSRCPAITSQTLTPQPAATECGPEVRQGLMQNFKPYGGLIRSWKVSRSYSTCLDRAMCIERGSTSNPNITLSPTTKCGVTCAHGFSDKVQADIRSPCRVDPG